MSGDNWYPRVWAKKAIRFVKKNPVRRAGVAAGAYYAAHYAFHNAFSHLSIRPGPQRTLDLAFANQAIQIANSGNVAAAWEFMAVDGGDIYAALSYGTSTQPSSPTYAYMQNVFEDYWNDKNLQGDWQVAFQDFTERQVRNYAEAIKNKIIDAGGAEVQYLDTHEIEAVYAKTVDQMRDQYGIGYDIVGHSVFAEVVRLGGTSLHWGYALGLEESRIITEPSPYLDLTVHELGEATRRLVGSTLSPFEGAPAIYGVARASLRDLAAFMNGMASADAISLNSGRFEIKEAWSVVANFVDIENAPIRSVYLYHDEYTIEGLAGDQTTVPLETGLREGFRVRLDFNSNGSFEAFTFDQTVFTDTGGSETRYIVTGRWEEVGGALFWTESSAAEGFAATLSETYEVSQQGQVDLEAVMDEILSLGRLPNDETYNFGLSPETVSGLVDTTEFLSRNLGSMLGRAIGGGNDAIASATSAIFSVVAGEFGETIANALLTTGVDLVSDVSNIIEGALENFDATLYTGLKASTIGAISSFLTLELGDLFGGEGVVGEAFGAASNSFIGIVVENVVESRGVFEGLTNVSGLFGNAAQGSIDAANGVAGASQTTGLLSSAVGGFLGAQLGQLVVSPTTAAGGIVGSLGSAVGAWAFGAGAGSVGAIGTFAAALTTKLGFLGNFIVPGIGSFIGIVLGTLVGNLFGASKPRIPEADAETNLSFSTGYFEAGAVSSENGGDEELVKNMSNSARDTLNGIIELTVFGSEIAANANISSPSQTYGHTGGQIWVELAGDGERHEFESASAAVEYGALWAIGQTKIVGGGLYLKRALYNNSLTSILGMSGDMQIAEDYALYKENLDVINGAIASSYDSLSSADKNFYGNNAGFGENTNQARISRVISAPRDSAGNLEDDGSDLVLSASDLTWYIANRSTVDRIIDGLRVSEFAAGWIATLQRASELGLNQTSESDFFGGLAGFSDSLQILSDFEFDHEHVSISLSGTTLNVDYSIDANNADTWAATNFFSGANYHLTQGIANTYLTGGTLEGEIKAIQQAEQEDGAGAITGAGYNGGSGFDTSGRGDLWIHSGSAAATMDDRHTETYVIARQGGGSGGFFGPIFDEISIQVVEIEGGDDIFVGGSGNDTLYGRSGFDWLDGGAGSDTIYGGSEDDTLLGRAGADVLHGETGDDYLAGGDDNDKLYGGTGNDRLIAMGGYDELFGQENNDTLFVSLAAGSTSLADGGTGTDTLSFDRLVNEAFLYQSFPDVGGVVFTLAGSAWSVGAASGTFTSIENAEGSRFNDRITGNGINNELWGGAGDDYLDGGAGNDVLEGGMGSDELIGGAGSDTASYHSSRSAVWVDFANDEAFGGDAEGDTFSGIENLRGSAFDDTFEGNAQTNLLQGGRGDDWLVATGGNDRFEGGADFDTVDYSEYGSAVIVNLQDGYGSGAAAGHSYNDIEHVVGSDHKDTLTGDANDNVFQGGQGNDTLSGGSGLDTYIYHRGDGADRINEAHKGGWDTLMFGDGISWSDLSVSNAGNILNFFVAGGAAGDGVSVDQNWTGIPDKGSRGAKIDSIDVGGVGAVDIQHLEGGSGGSDGADTILGDQLNSNHADILIGYGGDDVIRAGGVGDYDNKQNLIIGGRGNDTIRTSVGDDTFVFERGDGFDTITDTGGADRIQFGPSVAAEDVIFEIVGNDLYMGIRDLDRPELKASLVDDRIRVINGANTASGYAVEFITAGGVDIDLRKLVLENGANQDFVWDGLPYGQFDLNAGVPVGDLLGGALSTLGYDPENDQTQFDVIGLPPGMQLNAATGQISGTPSQAGIFDVTIRARDTGSNQASERTIQLNVTQLNRAPVSTALGAQTAQEDGAYSYNVASAFSDPDGDNLTFSASLAGGGALPSWLSFNASTATFSGTPPQSAIGTNTVQVTATDPDGLSTVQNFNITVQNTNDGPRIAAGLANRGFNEDSTFSFALPANAFVDDDPNDSVTLSASLASGAQLPSWLTFNASTQTFSATPTQSEVGSYSIRVTAQDQSSAQVSNTFVLTINNVNDAPVLAIATPDFTPNEDTAFSYTWASNAFTDVDDGSLALTVRQTNGASLPAWLTFNASTRTISGTPSQGDLGNLSLRITATDGSGASVSDDFSLNVSNVNDAPVAAIALSNRNINEDASFSYQVPIGAFTDPDGDTLSLSATLDSGLALPAWLSFDAGTRTFSGTPGQGDVGNIAVRVTATDPSGASVSRSFAIGVINVNDAPVVTIAIADSQTQEDQAFTLTLPANTFTDEDGDPLALSATQADGSSLPAWLTFDAASRTFSGTPNQSDTGALTIRVTATDQGGAAVFDEFSLSVSNTNDVPVVATGIGNRNATEDEAFSYTFASDAFTDPDGDTLTYSATLQNGTALPGWLSFDTNTRTFSGTPSQSDVGAITVRVTADDGANGTVFDEFVLDVTDQNDAPVVSVSLIDQSANEDQSFSYTVPSGAFSDADGDVLAITASLVVGGVESAIPSWLNFDPSTSALSGTPSGADTGQYIIRFTASDGRGGSVSDDILLDVGGTNDAPTVNVLIPDTTATEDTPFVFTIASNTFIEPDGQNLSLSATLANGTQLPTWLTFDAQSGEFSGTPLEGDSGFYQVVVTADDGAGGTVSDEFLLTVDAVNDAPVAAGSLSTATAREGENFALVIPVNLFSDPDGDVLSITAELSNGDPLPTWLSYDPSRRELRGQPRDGDSVSGSLSVRIYASDGTIADIDRPSVDVTIDVLGAGSPPTNSQPSLVLFDDQMQNGAGFSAGGLSTSVLSSSGDPVYSGSNSIKATGGAWSQAGVELGVFGLDATNGILRFMIYRETGSDGAGFVVRHGSWASLDLDSSNNGHWSIDGQTGYSDLTDLTVGTWHEVEVDLLAIGVTDFLSINIMGNGDGGDVFYFDDVALWPTSGGGSPPPPPTDAPWVWDSGILPNVELTVGDALSTIDPTTTVSDPDSDVTGFTFAWSGHDAAGLQLDTNGHLTGVASNLGTHEVTLTVTDPVTGQSDDRTFNVTVLADGTPPPVSQPSLVLFDDQMQNSAGFAAGGLSTSVLSSAGDPVYSGTNSVKATGGAWNQAGVELGVYGLDATNGILRFMIYREVGSNGAGFVLRHGSWESLDLDATNNTHWMIDGQTGFSDLTDLTIGTWHQVEVDLLSLGVSDFLSINIMGDGDGNDVFYFDDVALWPVGGGSTPPSNNAPWAWGTSILPNVELTIGDTIATIDPTSTVIDSDSDVANFGYVWSGYEAAGLQLDSNGHLTGSVSQLGNHTITLTVTDPATGQSDTRSFTISAEPVGSSGPPPLPTPPPIASTITGTTDGDNLTDTAGSQLYDGLSGWDILNLPGVEGDYVFSTESDGTGLIFHSNGDVDRVVDIEGLYFVGSNRLEGEFKFFGVPQGTAAADTIIGTDASERLTGLGGDDMFFGAGGNDRIEGGDGWDRVNLDGEIGDFSFVLHEYQNDVPVLPYGASVNGIVVITNNLTGQVTTVEGAEQVHFLTSGQNADMNTVITATTDNPVPEFLATPIDGHITDGGFAYPVLIDLGGNGVDLVSVSESRVVFESESGGPLMRMGWIGPQDGMLVLDRDGDGIINRLSEISFVNDLPGARSDLEGLRAYDSNDDGVFDGQDSAWSLFQVWRDVNQNGVGTGAELATLDQMGISSINLSLDVIRENTDGYADNVVLNEASITMTDGGTRTIYDVALRGELAHVSGPAAAAIPSEWVTYSWTTDGAFGVAHAAAGHSGIESDLADLQLLNGGDLIGANIPMQDLVRYMDADDSLAAPAHFVFDPNDPLTPTFGLMPIVLDLDGDGVELINPAQSGILRDGNNDGALDRLGWVHADDGILALDRDGNGEIDPITEISFVDDLPGANTDLEGLRAFDTNQDGWFDAQDAEFDRFQIWQDVNYNAISEDGELRGLAEAGIARIHLTSEENSGYQDGPLTNRVFGEALFEWSDGSVGRLGDVELRAFEGNALEQALQAERRARLMAQQQFGEMSELLRRRNAMNELGESGSPFAFDETAAFESGRAGRPQNDQFSGAEPSIAAPTPVQDSPEARAMGASSQLMDFGLRWQNQRQTFGYVNHQGEFSRNLVDRDHNLDEWWLNATSDASRFGARSSQNESLADRLAQFDLARDLGDSSNEGAVSIPNQNGAALAERQRFLQAIASFRGSSGVPLTRRFGETSSETGYEIGSSAMWLKSGNKSSALA